MTKKELRAYRNRT